MKMVCKDEVVDWFHKLNGAGRLDAMCALLDVCLPFEIRFLGTYMENLGRRDFHELRDADHRANSFLHLSRPGVTDRQALCNALVDPSPHHTNGSIPSASNVSSGTISRQNLTSPDSSTSSSRSNSVQSTEKPRVTGSNTSSSASQATTPVAPEVSFVANRQGEESGDNGSKASTNTSPGGPASNENNEYEEGGKCLLMDDLLRRRLVLYMSLLSATNRRCANAYYKVLKEVQPLLEQNNWLETMEESMMDEMALLYTISANHPALTFEQRRVMSEVGDTFRSHQTKLEAPKVPAQPAPTFYATAVQGFDPKYGHYYIHCIPHALPAMQWQNPAGSGGLIRTSNGTVDESNLQSPVTFTIPPYHPFPPAIFMPAHNLQSPTQIHHHSPQVQQQHQFSSNIPVQSPQGAGAPPPMAHHVNHHHPSQIHPQNSYGQNPRVPLPNHNNTNAVHMQSQPRLPHPTVNNNGPVPTILNVPISNSIHAQMNQPVGHTAVISSSSVMSQVNSSGKSGNVSQLSPSTVPNNLVTQTVGSNLTAPTVAPYHITTQANNNSTDGNDSEELCWDSSESSPYQSPLQSLTPSRSQSPIPVQYVAPLISNQSQPNFGSNYPLSQSSTFSAAPNQQNFGTAQNYAGNSSQNFTPTPSQNFTAIPMVTPPHLLASQPELMISHPSTTLSSSLPQPRPVVGGTTVAAVSAPISPPPRSQQQHSGGSSQNSRMAKNSQTEVISTGGALNHNTVTYSNSGPKTSNNSLVNSSSSMNGMLPEQQRRQVGKAASVSALIKNLNHTTSPGFASTAAPPPSIVPPIPMVSQSSQPGLAVSSANFPPNNTGSRSYGNKDSRRPVNSRRSHNNNASSNNSVNTTCSMPNHFNVHSLPVNKTALAAAAAAAAAASTNHNLSQYNVLPFPFPSKGVTTTHGVASGMKQQPPLVQTVTSHDGGILFSNDVSFCGDSLIPTLAVPPPNGIKVPTHLIDTFTTSVPSGLSVVNVAAAAVPPVPAVIQLPLPTPPPLVQTSRNPVLLEVGGGQDLVTEGTQFSSLVDDGAKMTRPKMSCYTCGAQSHYGPDCKENTMEEMTKNPYRINYHPENSTPETKDGE